jgi:phosphoribosylformylglycinamidine synthase subunit PurL
MKYNSIISIQDMGAAGLTSSSVEMASKGELGIELHLDKVPCREEGMTPYEMMLSESQERMLIILEDNKENDAKKIFDKWDLDFVVIGKTTGTKKLTIKYNGETVGEIPIEALASKAPIYDRKWTKIKLPEKKIDIKDLKKIKLEDALIKILSSPNQSNKRWVTEQFDQMVMTDTAERSGGDSAIIRIHKKEKAIAVSVDSSANYCKAHPYTGGKQIVCENWRNIISVGAKPIAITNCLNFGNPENSKVMGEFVECLKGIKEACEFLDYPVVSGNVSFYNGTNKKNIYPTPVIGGVGLINNVKNKINHSLKKENNLIIQIGKAFGHLSQSAFYEEIYSLTEGPPPEVNLSNERNNGLSVFKLINNKLVSSVHDISSGGLIIALTEMSLSSNYGLKIRKPQTLKNLMEYFFGEDQGRYLIEIEPNNLEKVKKLLDENNVLNEIVASVQKDKFEIIGELKISVNELSKINNKWYKNY